MGLDVSHDCFHGSYTAYSVWREWLARYAGIPLAEMAGFGGSRSWREIPWDLIQIVINHSDCDGSIPFSVGFALADRLETIADNLVVADPLSDEEMWRQACYRFAKGLRIAAENFEDVEYH